MSGGSETVSTLNWVRTENNWATVPLQVECDPVTILDFQVSSFSIRGLNFNSSSDSPADLTFRYALDIKTDTDSK